MYVVREKSRPTGGGVGFTIFFPRGDCVYVVSHDAVHQFYAVGEEQVQMELEN